MQAEFSLPSLKSIFNQQALAQWETWRAGARMPARIDMVEAAPLLNGIILIDVLNEPRDFHYRFVGSRIDEFLTRTLTGRRISEIDFQKPPSRIWSALCRVIDTGEPVSGEVPYVGPKQDFVTMEDVVMPVSAGGDAVTSLFIAVDFFRKDKP